MGKENSRRKTIFGSLAMDVTGRATKAELASPGQAQAEEVLEKKRTKSRPEGEEVFEEDGFIFKRVKKSGDVLQGREGVTEERGANDASRSGAEEGVSTPSNDSNLEGTIPAYPRSGTASASLHELASEALCDDERLLQICADACLLETDLAKATFSGEQDAFVADAVVDVLNEFQLEVEYLLVEGNLSFAEAEAKENPSPANDDSSVQSMLEARKATLRSLVSKYEAENAEWEFLLQQCASASAGPPEGQVSACKKAAQEAAAQVNVGSFKGKVKSACSDAFRKIKMQVAGAQAVIRAAEDMCMQADRVGVQVATKHSVKEFRGLPHINSPQELIRRLTSAPPAAGH